MCFTVPNANDLDSNGKSNRVTVHFVLSTGFYVTFCVATVGIFSEMVVS